MNHRKSKYLICVQKAQSLRRATLIMTLLFGVAVLAACRDTLSLTSDMASDPIQRIPSMHTSVPTVAPVSQATVPTPFPHISDSIAPPRIVPAVANDTRAQQLLDHLQQRGIELEPFDVSQVPWLNVVPGQAYRVGEWWLHLHVFPDEAAAKTVAVEVLHWLKYSQADWVGTPHFFRCAHLIALHFGSDNRVLTALAEQCGPQFAGDENKLTSPEPTEQPLTTVDAALHSLIRSGFGSTASAPQILIEQQLASGVAILYTYTAQVHEQPVMVTHISYLDWRDPIWYPDGNQYNVRHANDILPPVQFLNDTYVVNGGPDTPKLPDTVTFAGGIVSDPAVVSVAVTFSDGVRMLVPVQRGAYLAARLDAGPVVGIEALDVLGIMRYQFVNSSSQ